ncbi:hypothetical protein SAMN05216388_101751 [Halorientalis persicus]|uniref:Uncharacterized protein n=1 Tax=Halorientalis persicus TaxID=1367881 RepID=A0A1H8RWU3_9EURY|nr:hypothetical protein [Halorientalis persicus]SEO70393.1 hypothetical protein SAMN05216388_101751 [Halorientalis persicus]
MLDTIIRLLRQAGAYRESDTDRNGVLSYAAETHAVGYGGALGATVAIAVLGLPWPLAVWLAGYGVVWLSRWTHNERILSELRREPQYFLGASVASLVVTWGLAAVAGIA